MGIETCKSIVFSLALSGIAAVWLFKYGSARRARKYSQGRTPIVRDERFRTFGKVIFLVSNLVTLASLWTNSPAILSIFEDHRLRVTGMVVLIVATLLHVNSMKHLGENYSPCFDSYHPVRLVKHGPYQYIRHPIYLANILLCAGYSMASSSVWVLMFSGYGAYKMWRALEAEESYLTSTFPGYEEYQAKTARLVPFIY
jgi:protein-S-isoprenylcysteine O-methyltransferase Ste14